MPKEDLLTAIVAYVAQRQGGSSAGVAAGAIEAHLGRPRPTVNRALANLAKTGRLERHGAGRAIVYRIPEAAGAASSETTAAVERTLSTLEQTQQALPWSPQARARVAQLSEPLGTRKPITYQRSFVDNYIPNASSFLPALLASQLYEAGRSKDQLPAGTYARKVLEQLLIDLSWFSSRLEGNRKSLLDTRHLFEKGRSETDDKDATMLLNHKEAIEFLVDAVPTEGITVPVVRNIQSLLMRDLLADPADLGAIRKKIVNIQDTVYVPSQVPNLLEEMLGHIVDKARQVRNPVEASFFLWVNIAYLPSEVESFAEAFFDPKRKQAGLHAYLKPAADRFAELSETEPEDADQFRKDLGTFLRMYDFLSQLVAYDDPDLEKLYAYGKNLMPRIIERTSSSILELDADVRLTHYRLQKIGEQKLDLASGGVIKLKAGSEAGTGAADEDEKKQLAEIVGVMNDLFSGNLTEGDMVGYVTTITEKLMESEALAEQARNNSEQQFAMGDFKDIMTDAIIDSQDGHNAIAGQLLKDERVFTAMLGMLAKQVYRAFERQRA